jgi:cathepsin D
LLVDIASPYTWVADTSCSECPDSMQLYDPSSSELSTEGTSATLTYGSVAVSGTVITDTFELGIFLSLSQNFREGIFMIQRRVAEGCVQ